MKNLFRRLTALALAILLFLPLCLTVQAEEKTEDVTVLFTHDLHSHLLPAEATDGGEYGGYARLMTVIDRYKAQYPDALLVDGGDFSMGSLFQTAYATSALELRIMGAMGYDVTTLGNHEFDYLPKGLASMLNVAADCGETVPAIVATNYLPDPAADTAEMVWEALDHYGVREYILLERGGVPFAVFGLFGDDAHACAPNSGMLLVDPVEVAQGVVDAARKECLETYGMEPVVIALSHGGTVDGQGEDYELAQQVDGIHLIISGHSHTTLEEAIEVDGTWIVSGGEYGKYLGVVQMDRSIDGSVALNDYELVPIDETVPEEPGIAAMVEQFKTTVEQDYLSQYGLGFDQVLLNNSISFETVPEITASLHESTVCNVFSDAYKWAAEQTTGETVDVALTAAGVIRETIPMGEVTVSDIFNAASLGVGTEGELVEVYLTGRDLKCALEVDGTLAPMMPSVQLYMSGIEYSVNHNRMFFNKVDSAFLRRNDGTLEPIEDDKLYRVICGTYMAQMLGTVESSSFGLLTITPRDENGDPISVKDTESYVLRDENGKPVKEWYAICDYLLEMDGEMDAQYAGTDGRKVVYSSWNPVNLLKNANKFTYILLAVAAVLILLVVVIVRLIRRRSKRKKQS